MQWRAEKWPPIFSTMATFFCARRKKRPQNLPLNWCYSSDITQTREIEKKIVTILQQQKISIAYTAYRNVHLQCWWLETKKAGMRCDHTLKDFSKNIVLTPHPPPRGILPSDQKAVQIQNKTAILDGDKETEGTDWHCPPLPQLWKISTFFSRDNLPKFPLRHPQSPAAKCTDVGGALM